MRKDSKHESGDIPVEDDLSRSFMTSDFVIILLQFSLIWLAVYFFEIEAGLGLKKVLLLALGGFVIHDLLKARLRLPFFVSLSMVGLFVTLGFYGGLTTIVLSLLLLAICHLPIPYKIRIGILLSAVLVIGLIHAGVIDFIRLRFDVVVVLASLMMFRLMLYVYELQYEKEPTSIWTRLGYFFLLPNIIFPIFPIVDYKTFKRKYFDGLAIEIYARGTNLMLLGLSHLLLYRLIYAYFLPDANEVDDAWSLTTYIVFSYTLILRLSGIFHFVIGLLCMFGFNLPKIFDNYFLSNGFGDYWRRINIYWKDFVVKLFFYPLYFRWRKSGVVFATIAATIVVFIINSLLHSYQWFWITGGLSLKPTDLVFWLSFGVLVAGSAYWQTRQKKVLKNGFRSSLIEVAKIMMTFSVIAILWSIWINPDMRTWWQIVSGGLSGSFDQVFLLGGTLLLILFAGGVIHFAITRKDLHKHLTWSNQYNLPVLAVLCLIGSPWGKTQLESYTQQDLGLVLRGEVKSTDAQKHFNGYYDELLEANVFTSPISTATTKSEAKATKLRQTDLLEQTNNLLLKRFKKGRSDTYKGAPFHVNSLGLRDREYDSIPSANTTRIALLGGSLELGGGVMENETFENIVEDSLNKSHSESERRYEILNYAMDGQSLIQHVYQLENQVVLHRPDHLILTMHSKDWMRMCVNLYKAIQMGVDLNYGFIDSLVTSNGIDTNMLSNEMYRIIEGRKDDVFMWAYKRMVTVCREYNIQPIWVYLPAVRIFKRKRSMEFMKSDYDYQYTMAKEAGFACIDLSDVYKDKDIAKLKLAAGDGHLSKEGHRVVAGQLYEKLKSPLNLINESN